MIHVGDITKLNGAELEPVDIIVGGSPCQDLSVAGKRQGLAGERSGLFMEQIRIIKEMRKHNETTGRTNRAVRWGVWENVPGAYSSNSGEDFKAVLEEFCRVKDPDAVIPRPPKGKWPHAGCIIGDDYSVAWRTHDAQYFGVAQRRKRISLVADFDGHLAPWVLFDAQYLGETSYSGSDETESNTGAASGSFSESLTESVSGYSDSCETAGEGTAASAEGSTGAAGFGETGIGYWQNGIQTLRAEGENRPSRPSNVVVQEPILLESNQNHATVQTDGVSTTLPASMGMGGGYVPMVTEEAISFQERAGKPGGGKGILIQNERVGALSTLNNQSVCYGISSYASNAMLSDNPHSGIYEADTARTLDLNGGSPACNQGGIVVLEGNGARPSHQGDGFKESETMYTLNTTEVHAVLPFDTTSITSPQNGNNPHYGDPFHTLGAKSHPPTVAMTFEPGVMSRTGGHYYEEVSGTLRAEPGDNRMSIVAFAQNQRDEVRDLNDVAGALSAEPGMKQQTFICLNDQGGSVMSVSEDVTATLRAQDHGHPPLVSAAGFDGSMGAKAGNIGYAEEQAPTLNAGKEMHVYDARGNGDGEVCCTITGDHQNRITDYTAIVTEEREEATCMDVGMFQSYTEQCPTQLARQYKDPPVVVREDPEAVGTLCAESYPGKLAHQDVQSGLYPLTASVVRRLSPKECERLQGFPDDWTNIGEWVDSKGKKHKPSSSPRYKALGNSIALPFWQELLARISATYPEDYTPTLGSLFDGIGGFPLCWEQINGKGTARWASEIEEFPIAVTKLRFPEEEET